MQHLETLRKLASIPSITGDESVMADYIADACDSFGYATTRVGDSVAAHIPGVDGTKAFILNGHIDTIPVVEGWKTDPFKLEVDPVDPDIFRFLGASDMKGALSFMLDQARAWRASKPPCAVWLLFTRRGR